MAAQTELILRVQAQNAEAIDKVQRQLGDLEKTTEQWSNAQQRAAMASAGMHERALQMNEAFGRQQSVLTQLTPVATVFAAAVAAVGYAFAKTLTETLDYVEGLEKANKQTGISIDFWQKLIKTGAEMNTSFDEIRSAVERMERAIEGDGKALAKFGIDVAAFKGLSPDEAFRAMAVQIMAIQNPTERAAAAMAVFGKSGAEIIPMLDAIVDGSVDAQKALGTGTVNSLLAADKALDQVKTAWKDMTAAAVGFVVQSLPIAQILGHIADGLRMISEKGGPVKLYFADMVGAAKLLQTGNLALAEATRAAYLATGRQAEETHKTSRAVLDAAAAAQQARIAADALAAAQEKAAKAEAKAEEAAKKHRLTIVQGQKAAQDRALVAVAAAEKEVQAELKRMNFTAQGEKDLTAKLRGEQAAQFRATEEKYRKQAAEAARYYQQVIDGVTRSSQTEVERAQAVLDKVRAFRAEEAAAKRASDEDQKRSAEAEAAAEKALDDAKAKAKLEHFQMIAEAGSTMLRSLFGKNKTAAIAAAIIDTAAAVVTSFKNGGGFPWGLIPAGLMAAAGAVEIAKIKSQDAGFRTGTPGTSFVDFGRGSMEMLHGQEAVVTRGQADSVASMVRQAIDDANRRAVGGSGQANGEQKIHVHVHMDSKVVADAVVRRNRAGLAPMRAT